MFGYFVAFKSHMLSGDFLLNAVWVRDLNVFAWDDEKGLPIVAYPGECYHCAACDVGCPEEAISMMVPLHCLFHLNIYPEI